MASTCRWGILKEEKAKLKSLSDTQWLCRADASKDLNDNFDGIHTTLSHIADDIDQKLETRHKALCLYLWLFFGITYLVGLMSLVNFYRKLN